MSAPIASAPPTQTHPVRFGFAGVMIGADLEDLHRIRPRATCMDKTPVLMDCLAPDQPLGGGYFARDLTYRFANGRLAEIRFHSSIDAFAFVVAKMKHDFGVPADIRRDDIRLDGRAFPHVAFAWRNGRSTIRMSDPATPGQLEVAITMDAAGAT
jgi:hypothetical protein